VFAATAVRIARVGRSRVLFVADRDRQGAADSPTVVTPTRSAPASAAAAATAATAAAVVVPENRKMPTDEDGRYETVREPQSVLQDVPGTVVSPPLPADNDDQRDSDNGSLEKKELSGSSMDIDNSIYGINPPSESTSSGKVTGHYC